MSFPHCEKKASYVKASPKCFSKEELERRYKNGERDNVAAVGIQLKAFEILNNPFLDLTQETRELMEKIQSLAFSGYHPSTSEIASLEQICHRNERILSFVNEIRNDIKQSQSHWKATKYTGERLLFHQDVDAVANLASHLEEERIIVFGSARLKAGHPAYDGTQWLMRTLVGSLTHADGTTEQVITGGGPGIMEAANKGAMEGAWNHYQTLLEKLHAHPEDPKIIQHILNFRMQMQSLAIGIIVPHEQSYNEYLQGHVISKTFSPRKMGILSAGTGRSINHTPTEGPNGNEEGKRKPAIFVMTGGLGTLDENYEVGTLTQCNKLKNPLPIFIVGEKMSEIVKKSTEGLYDLKTIKPKDLELFIYCADEFDALEKYLDYYKTLPNERILQSIIDRRNEAGIQRSLFN
ncbi:MAG: LOG family protein [Candidatus Gracilibacteria bacterium]|nr:LOG family protein [Candidatus Gracilibacteria bacterium]